MKHLLLISIFTCAYTQEMTEAKYTVDLPPLHDAVCENELFVAAKLGNPQAIQHLIQEGAHIDAYDNLNRTPLYWACRYGYFNCAVILVDAGANPNTKSKGYWTITPLYAAACKRNFNVMQKFIDAGADIPAAIECARKHVDHPTKALLTGLLAIPQ